jgi:phosphatidylglycerophosphate synthase
LARIEHEILEDRYFKTGEDNVQGVLAIPGSEILQSHGGASEALMQKVAGVPLLVRVIATAVRAKVDSVLVIWPNDVDPAILESCAASSVLKGVRIEKVFTASAFDPGSPTEWRSIAGRIEHHFLWLPWNLVTTKLMLLKVSPTRFRPVVWHRPALLEKHAMLQSSRFGITIGGVECGVRVSSRDSLRAAERFLIANSGKPTDGMYSNFNRRLCWPVVRLLARTRVTPNALTLAGLLAAILAAFMYARGSYENYVAGALLFFLSGLFDEMDGMIARIKFRESAFGTWFEGFVDNFTYLAVFAGMIVGLRHQYGDWALKYGGALIVGCTLSIIVVAAQRKLATAPGRPNEYAGRMNQLMEADSSNPISKTARQVHIFVKKGVLVHYLLIFTVLGGLPVFLWLAAIGSNLTWILTVYFTRRFFPRPPFGAVKGVRTAA